MSYSVKQIRTPLQIQRAEVSIFLVQVDPNTGEVCITIPKWDEMQLKTNHVEGLIQNILNTIHQNFMDAPITRNMHSEMVNTIDRLVKYNRGVPEFDAFLTANGY